jgi:C-terminal processing protease CtpA/Prc
MVMLINEHTCSAGEMVAAFASENNLAKLVGIQTPGQVLGGANFSVGGGFVLRLPAAAWFMWHRGAVEGIGVPPHDEVPLLIQRLRFGHDTQLESGIALVQNQAVP